MQYLHFILCYQTCNFKQRFDKHLSTIRNHLKFNNYKNCELATHFNTDLTHRNNWEESRVFKCDMLLEYINHFRLSYEQEIIRLFKSLDISVLNVKLSYNSIKTFISKLVNKR
jgi:hypothetical protein